jgi:hypothetical protein
MEFNFVKINPFWTPEMERLLFQPKPGEIMEAITPDMDMFDILVDMGVFKSRSDARKNWKQTGKDIPEGFTDLKGIGKMKHRLTIWVPINDLQEPSGVNDSRLP